MKLTADKVRRIRKAAKLRRQLSNKALALRLEVSVGSIRNVIKGSRWAHVS